MDTTSTSLVAQRSVLMEFCEDPGAEVVVRIQDVVRQRQRRKAHDLVSFKITHALWYSRHAYSGITDIRHHPGHLQYNVQKTNARLFVSWKQCS